MSVDLWNFVLQRKLMILIFNENPQKREGNLRGVKKIKIKIHRRVGFSLGNH